VRGPLLFALVKLLLLVGGLLAFAHVELLFVAYGCVVVVVAPVLGWH